MGSEDITQKIDPYNYEAAAERRDNEDAFTRWLGERGILSEIATPLPNLLGSVETVSINIPEDIKGKFISSTPSISIHNGQRRAIVRGVNYRHGVDQSVSFVGNDQKCRTKNWWVEFDENWRPSAIKEVGDSFPDRPGAVQGWEDCRLFWSDGWKASANFAERPQLFGPGAFSLLCEMALLEISDGGDIQKVSAVRGPWSIHNQKNWKPICDGGIRWIYSTDPLVLVDPSMTTDPKGPKWSNCSAWRGGSQAIRLGSRWIWIDHRPVLRFDGNRNLYLHRFVVADSGLTKIEAISAPFVFQGYGVEFCAGMAIDGDKVVISYSTRDSFSYLSICSLDAVIKTLGRAI